MALERTAGMNGVLLGRTRNTGGGGPEGVAVGNAGGLAAGGWKGVGGTIWPGPGKAGGIPSGLGVGNGGGKGGAFWSGTALGAMLGLAAGDASPLGGAGDGLD